MSSPSAARRRRGTVAALLLTTAPVQAIAVNSNQAHYSSGQPVPTDLPPDIIVIGQRLFPDIAPERSLGEQEIGAYGLSTVEDLVDEIRAELDEDEEPVFVVNGERVYNIDDIAGFPVEVLRQVQVLPRGTGAKVGGRTNQRVYSLKLRRQMRSATIAAAPKLSTAGEWGSRRAEVILTHLQGAARFNVSVRIRDEDSLLESDRNIIQPERSRLSGSRDDDIIGYPSLWHEIDPLLSGAGSGINVVAPMTSNTNPSIASSAAATDSFDSLDLGEFRTLRPDSRNYDLNATFGTRLAPWLTTSANIRVSHSRNRSLRGLPSSPFLIETHDTFSPLSARGGLALNEADPLRSLSEHTSGHANLAFNATVGKWRATLNARHAEARNGSRSDRSNQLGPVGLGNQLNPFSSNFSDLGEIVSDRFSSRTGTSSAQLTLYGSPLQLPAGSVGATIEGRIGRTGLKARSSFWDDEDRRSFSRSERAIRGLLEVPLASARNDFLEPLGELSANVEFGRARFSDAGTLNHHAYGLSWEPRPFIRLRGAVDHVRRPAEAERLSGAVVITPDVRIFDLIRGETVDVTQISGGNPLLRPESIRTSRLSSIVRVLPRLGLQLSGEYSDTKQRNLISSLPPVSIAVFEAFPDRFVRNPDGVLSVVDVRPVNFAKRHEQRVRYGFSLNAPLGGGSSRMAERPAFDVPAETASEEEKDEPAAAGQGGPRTRLQLSANHTLVLNDEIDIRPGLERVDLLQGGAFAVVGGRVRHQLDTLIGVSSGGAGARLSGIWRGPSVLETRIGGTPGQLLFSSFFTLNLRAFADAARLVPSWEWAKGTRISLNALNLTDSHQTIRDSGGETPLQFQRGYRDPLGRTIEVELRRIF